MTTASADVLIEAQGRETLSWRSMITRRLGIRALGKTIRRTNGAAKTTADRRPLFTLGVGVGLMAAGMAIAGAGLMHAGEEAGNHIGDRIHAAVAPYYVQKHVRPLHLEQAVGPVSTGGLNMLLGGALAAYGLRDSRRRYNEPAYADAALTANESMLRDDAPSDLSVLHTMLDEPYRPCLLERMEERFDIGVVAVRNLAVDIARRTAGMLAARRAYVAKVRADAAAASRYEGLASVSVMIEHPGLGVPDYTA
jgi:hypothetical protein